MVNLRQLRLSGIFALLMANGQISAQNAPARTAAEAYLDSAYQKYSIYNLEGQKAADTALMIDPTFAAVWQQKAMPHLKNGDFPHWIELIDRAVALDSSRWLDYRAFCKIVFMKDYEGGMRDIKMAQKKAPNAQLFVMDHSFDYWLSLCYMETGRLDSAIYHMQKSVDNQLKARTIDWAHYGDLFYLGVLYFDAGNSQKAINYLDASLKNYPAFPDALYFKALIFNDLGRKEEARAIFKQLIESREKGNRMNEDNEVYANFPRQIGVGEVELLRKKLEL